MYLLYLDDSGSVENRNEDYFVLGGLCVPEQSIRWITYELEKLAQDIYPENRRLVEFHASEIFGGRGDIWGRIRDREDRVNIIKNVLNVLQEAHASTAVFACAIHKDSYPNEDLIQMAFEDVSSRFDRYLQRVSSETGYQHKGLIVIDKGSHENSLQKLAQSFREEGNRWGNQLRTICEVPMFVDSKASRVIQLADHIAYAVFRRYNARDLNYFDCIEGRFDRKNGVIHGLAHKQHHNPHCTCPACLTRR